MSDMTEQQSEECFRQAVRREIAKGYGIYHLMGEIKVEFPEFGIGLEPGSFRKSCYLHSGLGRKRMSEIIREECGE